MQRREVLNTLAFAGATVPAAMLSEAAAPSSRAATSTTRTNIGPFVEAHDGTRLYCAQWGTAARYLFLNGAGNDHPDVGLPGGRIRRSRASLHHLRSPRSRALRHRTWRLRLLYIC